MKDYQLAFLGIGLGGATSISPAASWLLLSFALWLTILALQRYAPGVWAWAKATGPKGHRLAFAVSALPAGILGAVVGAAQSGGDVQVAALGAIAGILAPLWAHALRRPDDQSWAPPSGSTVYKVRWDGKWTKAQPWAHSWDAPGVTMTNDGGMTVKRLLAEDFKSHAEFWSAREQAIEMNGGIPERVIRGIPTVEFQRRRAEAANDNGEET